jgi:CubicO group peptidase (beta-lactamase class C family)
MHRGNHGSQTNAPARPLPCSSFRRDLSIQPGHTPVATIIGEIDPPVSGTVRTLAVVAGMPLPEAKPNDVRFSQPVLARLDDFFAREMAAKRVSGAVVAIARDDKLVHHNEYGQLDSTKDTPIPLDAVFALASMTKPMAAVAELMLLEQCRSQLTIRLA